MVLSLAWMIVWGFVAFVALMLLIALFLRRVVPTNEVHSIQSGKATVSYGKYHDSGNTYYEWPSWLPKIGIVKIILPVSVFGGDLEAYEAYDKGRLPFVVDVKAFFRISVSNLAAQRVSSFNLSIWTFEFKHTFPLVFFATLEI